MMDPRIYRVRRHARRAPRRSARTARLVVPVLLAAVLAWVAVALASSPPPVRLALAVPATPTVAGSPLALHPPSGVEEAVALNGVGTIASAGREVPAPIASLTKMMSALVVLHDHPLRPGEPGPRIVVSAADVASYRLERSSGDSVVAVAAGEQLSELQALEGALVPSGDNVIQLLARWDAGSTGAFVARMNAFAARLGLDHTRYAGPSGVNPATVSTATDQLRLAQVAMADPVFAGIVRMPEVVLPVAGVEYNVNGDLGRAGIDGIKTGWIPQSGGCLAFSATGTSKGASRAVIGVILGVQGGTPIPTVLAAARRLAPAAGRTLGVYRLPAGTDVATLTPPGGPPVRVVTTAPITLPRWNGARLHLASRLALGARTAMPAGARVGMLTVTLDRSRRSSPLATTGPVASPSLAWRFTHV